MDNKTLFQILAIALVTVLVASAAFYAIETYVMPKQQSIIDENDQPTSDKYTTGLTTNFNINDAAAGAAVTTNVKASFYPTSADILGASSSGLSITSATYSAPSWSTIMDKGSYKLLVSDTRAGSSVFYPTLQTVTVPGTSTLATDGSAVVRLNPAVIQLTERATPTMTAVVKGWNAGTSLYSTAETALNFTASVTTKFQVTLTVQIAGTAGQKVEAGRIYVPTTTGMTYSSATINGAAATLKVDTVGTNDGVSGSYVEFGDSLAGSTITFAFHVQKTGAGPTTGVPLVPTFYEDYAVQNSDYRFWSAATASITVTNA